MPAWGWALVAFGLAVALSALVLSVPVDVKFNLARPSSAGARVRVEWLWGLIGVSVAGTERAVRRARPTKRKRPARRARRGRWDMPDLEFVLNALRLARRLLHAIEVRWLRLRVVFGSADPAETGSACAVVMPAFAFVSSAFPNVEARAEPDFRGARFDYELDASVRVWPLRLLVPVALFAARPSSVKNFARMRGRTA